MAREHGGLANLRWLMETPPMKTMARDANGLVGTYRTFGADGPVYQVLRQLDERSVRIAVVETGEELDYPAQQALDDPEAE